MSLKVHKANGLKMGKAYTLCFRMDLPVTDDKAKVSCWTCTKRIAETERFAKAVGKAIAKKVMSKRPSIYGSDGRVNV